MSKWQDYKVFIRNTVLGALLSTLIFMTLVYLFVPNETLRQFKKKLSKTTGIGQVKNYKIATASEEGYYYSIGKELSRELEGSDLHLKIETSNGSLDNIERLRNQSVDFALIQSGLPENLGGLACVANLMPQYVQIVVPRDSPVSTFKDLRGKRVCFGPENSGFSALGKRVFGYFQFEPPATAVSCAFSAMEAMLKEGKVDALFTVFSLHAPMLEELMRDGEYRLVPIPEAESISKVIPYCEYYAIPHSLYGPNRSIPAVNESPFYTLGVDTLLIARNNISESAVHGLLEAVYSPRFKKRANLTELEEKRGRVTLDLPLHEAADEYYSRLDPVSSDMFEIGSFFIAGLVFIGSVSLFIWERYKVFLAERRMVHIIPYFEEMMRFSKKVGDVEDINDLTEMISDIMQTQRRAERAWLAGDLDTEHMENLYSIYGIRSNNAFNKILELQLKRNNDYSEEIVRLLKELVDKEKSSTG